MEEGSNKEKGVHIVEKKKKHGHFLADGTELKNIEGRTVPPTGETEAIYKLIAELLKLSPKLWTAAEAPQAGCRETQEGR